MDLLRISCRVALAALAAPVMNAFALSISPEYPKYASENCIEGFVEIRFIVSEKGHPEQVEIVAAEPEGVFEEATLLNISRWAFEERPGTVKEQIVEYRLEECESSNP